MSKIKKILQVGNLLSLDVVLGAVAGMCFFVELLEATVPASAYLLLGMAVWSIYTLDHLWDAKSAAGKAHSRRHVFHQENFKKIATAWMLVVFTGLVLVAGLTELRFLLFRGLILGGMMVLWMSLIHIVGDPVSWLKEISTAAFYVIGIMLAPYLLMDQEEVPVFIPVFGADYFLVAWINLLILSYLDKESDRKDGFGSIVNVLSERKLRILVFSLAVLGIFFFFLQLLILGSFYHIFTGLLLVMLLIHVIVFLDPNQTKESARQKLEATFLIPIILLLL
jgi:4-hydroxybenzoate polyprenyltransferase